MRNEFHFLPINNSVLLPCTKEKVEDARQLAVDQIVHLIEGWMNYSVAVSCLFSNSISQAVHLAYYAELRAALSLFSWSGISIKQGKNFYLTPTGEKKGFGSKAGTHQVVWKLWSEWVKQDYAVRLLTDGIYLLPGVRLSDLMEQIPILKSLPIFLTNWGYDLITNPTQDKDFRNMASYGTQLCADRDIKTLSSLSCEFFFNIWELVFKLNGYSLYFDIYLLKYLLDKSPDQKLKFCDELRCCYQEQSSEILIKALQDKVNNNQIFEQVSSQKRNIEGVLSRAFVMLRYATLATKTSLTDADKLKQWMTNFLSVCEFSKLFEDDEPILLCEIAYTEAKEQCSPNDSLSCLLKEDLLPETLKLMRPSICLSWELGLD